AGDAGRGIDGGQGLIANRFQRGAQGGHAVRQGEITRQNRLVVATGEMNGAAVVRVGVVERVQGGHGEVERRSGGRRRGRNNAEMGGSSCTDYDGPTRSRDQRRNGYRRRRSGKGGGGS